MGLDKSSKEVIRQFIKGLSNRSVKKRLSTSRPSKFEQAVEWAMEFELDVQAERKDRPVAESAKDTVRADASDKATRASSSGAKEKVEDSTTIQQSLSTLTKQMEELHKRVTSMGQVVAKSAIPPAGASGYPPRRSMADIKCRACGDMGHFARDCPKSKSRAGRALFFDDGSRSNWDPKLRMELISSRPSWRIHPWDEHERIPLGVVSVLGSASMMSPRFVSTMSCRIRTSMAWTQQKRG